MNLRNEHELSVTRQKLRLIEGRYAANERDRSGDERVRELTMRSLRRLIDQLTEEIGRFESGRSLNAIG